MKKINDLKFVILFLVVIILNPSFILGSTTVIIQPPTYNFSNFTYTFNEPFLADSIVLRILTASETTCYYTESEVVVPSKVFEGNYGTKHEKFLGDLSEGIHNYYIICGENPNSEYIMKVVFKTKIPVYGTLKISEEPPLKEGQYHVSLITSKECSDTPKLEYTLDGITKKEVSLSGSGTAWKGYLIIPGNVGETVGTFYFDAYDVFGTHGTKLKGDNLFIIDTIKPDAIGIINAIGYIGQIKLEWFYEDSVKEFNIYKSENQQVDYTDFYKTSIKESYIDNDVEKGKTYYYRVAGVDEAGNTAALSQEIYATALLTNISTGDKGLDITLIGKVDNKISEINFLIEDISNIIENMNSGEGKEKDIFENLEFNKELQGIISELNSLKKDLENYKLQDLSETELQNKLNSADLRTNIIKKKAPENIVIIEENSVNREINEQNIEIATLEYLGEPSKNSKKEVDFVLNLAQEKGLKIESKFYNLEIVYLDGTRKDITLIKDSLNTENGDLEKIEDFLFIAYIPKEIVERASELEIKNTNYEVVKEDPVLSFYSDTKEIIYFIEGRISAGLLEEIILSPIKIIKQEEKQSITGNLVISNYFNKGSLGIIVLVVFGLGLLFYFVKIKNNQEIKPTLNTLEDVKKVGELIEQEKNQKAKELYSKIQEEYKNLSKKDKKLVVDEIKELNSKIIKW